MATQHFQEQHLQILENYLWKKLFKLFIFLKQKKTQNVKMQNQHPNCKKNLTRERCNANGEFKVNLPSLLPAWNSFPLAHDCNWSSTTTLSHPPTTHSVASITETARIATAINTHNEANRKLSRELEGSLLRACFSPRMAWWRIEGCFKMFDVGSIL